VVRPGEHLAIVGPSGAGKSTLANLVSRLLRPTSGSITLGGRALAEVPEPELRQRVALIPQEAYVFAGTLRENLAYLRSDVDESELTDAMRELGMTPLVERAGGFGARIGAGRKTLSTGEKQLVSLARTYLSTAEIVVLDEATCHLDPAAEAVVERAFVRRPGSLLVVAHRISSAMRADRVLLLDGEDSEIGTHDELLLGSARYAELVGAWCATPTETIGKDGNAKEKRLAAAD
jgi:ATP-binding cassette subfamily C protein